MPTPQSCVEGMVLVANPVRTKHTGFFSRVGTAWGFKHITLRVPATQILTALLLQQRWWDRPFGTAHFATVDTAICDHPSQFDQWDQCSGSVRSSLFWTFGGLPSHKVAPTKTQCRSAEFAQWNAKWGQIRLYQVPNFNCFSAVFAVSNPHVWPTLY